jgi:hypothetical protein
VGVVTSSAEWDAHVHQVGRAAPVLQVVLPFRPVRALELCTMECSRQLLRPGKDGGGT